MGSSFRGQRRFSRLDRGRTRTRWRDYMSDLTRERLWTEGRQNTVLCLHMSWQIIVCFLGKSSLSVQLMKVNPWRFGFRTRVFSPLRCINDDFHSLPFKVWANEYHEYEETSSLLMLFLFLMNYLIFSLCSRAESKTFSWIITHSFMRALGADERWNADVWSELDDGVFNVKWVKSFSQTERNLINNTRGDKWVITVILSC